MVNDLESGSSNEAFISLKNDLELWILDLGASFHVTENASSYGTVLRDIRVKYISKRTPFCSIIDIGDAVIYVK